MTPWHLGNLGSFLHVD